jgi:hypothetical protein
LSTTRGNPASATTTFSRPPGRGDRRDHLALRARLDETRGRPTEAKRGARGELHARRRLRGKLDGRPPREVACPDVQRIAIDHDFVKPVERVYAHLAEHENLGPLLGAKVTRVRDGDTERNGVGSVRALRVAVLPPFEETVTEAIPNELIRYSITQGSPLRDHHGELRFMPLGTGSHLRYVIEFGAVVPGLAKVVKLGLERSIRAALPDVDAKC